MSKRKQPNAVFKLTSKTAKTDTHKKHRYSVFGTNKPRNPLKNVLVDEFINATRLTSANRRKP